MECVRYLVVKMLAGKGYVVDAIYSYLVEDKGPSFLSRKYRVSKSAIRGYIMRFIEKAGGEAKARKLIKLIKESNTKVNPIIYKSGEQYICLLCNEKLDELKLEKHIITKHKAILQRHVEHFLEKIKKNQSVKMHPSLRGVNNG